jgi:hypothetical protein
MAKHSGRGKGIPSQEEVPAQMRYPHEDSCNEDIWGTSLPNTFPLGYAFKGTFEINQRTQRYGEFMHFAETEGVKKDQSYSPSWGKSESRQLARHKNK